MPKFSDTHLSAIRERLFDGMRTYRQLAGEDCSYGEKDIGNCTKIVDEYLAEMAQGGKRSQEEIRGEVKKAVVALNALNKKCGGKLIETDQREDLCALLLVSAKNAGLETDADITEEWREW